MASPSAHCRAQVAVLKSQLHSRDEELQTLFHWLDSVLGLRGYEAAGEVREQVHQLLRGCEPFLTMRSPCALRVTPRSRRWPA
jgi:hypothetical protein